MITLHNRSIIAICEFKSKPPAIRSWEMLRKTCPERRRLMHSYLKQKMPPPKIWHLKKVGNIFRYLQKCWIFNSKEMLPLGIGLLLSKYCEPFSEQKYEEEMAVLVVNGKVTIFVPHLCCLNLHCVRRSVRVYICSAYVFVYFVWTYLPALLWLWSKHAL